jgi:hypothetical protein
MQGLVDSLVKSTVPSKAVITTGGRTHETATSVGGAGAAVCFSVSNPICLVYTDPDGRDDEEPNVTKVREMLYEAVAFIQKNATTDEEKAVVAKITEMMNNKKVQLDDTEKRDVQGKPYGYFDPRKNTVTGEPRNHIVIDIDLTISEGFSELIDTLTHEGYHSYRASEGIWSDTITEETNAWNIGLNMSNKHRQQNGIEPYRTTPYTREDILRKGYNP